MSELQAFFSTAIDASPGVSEHGSPAPNRNRAFFSISSIIVARRIGTRGNFPLPILFHLHLSICHKLLTGETCFWILLTFRDLNSLGSLLGLCIESSECDYGSQEFFIVDWLTNKRVSWARDLVSPTMIMPLLEFQNRGHCLFKIETEHPTSSSPALLHAESELEVPSRCLPFFSFRRAQAPYGRDVLLNLHFQRFEFFGFHCIEPTECDYGSWEYCVVFWLTHKRLSWSCEI